MNVSDQNRSIQFIRFANSFYSNLTLLKLRYDRFKEINEPGNPDIDVSTYFDMIIVQLRAMCIESEGYKNNYTIQIMLQKIGKDEEAEKINKMLDKYPFSDDPGLNEPIEASNFISIRKAIKFLADKVICHYDNFDNCQTKKGLIEALISHLRNPYWHINLDYIMKTIFDCVDNNVTPEKLSQLLSEISTTTCEK